MRDCENCIYRKEMERTIWELSNQVTALTEQIIKLKSEKSQGVWKGGARMVTNDD